MRRRPATRAISVVNPKLSPPGSASFSPIGQLVDADEPRRAAVGPLDELLGAHAVGLADAPLTRGEHAPLDPAAGDEIRRDIGAGVDPPPLPIDRQERVHLAEDADQLADCGNRIGEAARVAGDRGDGPNGALGHESRCYQRASAPPCRRPSAVAPTLLA